MPLLMCPNCQTGMKELQRESVTFDMCPTCHGVWLDRGELQKLLEVTAAEPASAQAPPPGPAAAAPPAGYGPPPQQPGYAPPPPGYAPPQPGYAPPQPGWHRHHDDSDDDYKRGGYYGKPYRKKSTMARIFDIFD